MILHPSSLYVSLATLLTCFAGVLLFWASRLGEIASITQPLIIVSGMAFFAALSVFQRFLETRQEAPVPHITWNETMLQHVLAAEPVQPAAPAPTWEMSSAQLVGVDNTLAAAKLRMDLESALRRIAFEQGMTCEPRLCGLNHLLDQLVERAVLSPTVHAALREIIPLCNRALHGASLTNEDALRVMRMGNQLLDVLNSIRAMSV